MKQGIVDSRVVFLVSIDTMVPDKKNGCKILNISLSINLNICFGCSKKNLLSTHSICFGWEIRKLNFYLHSYLEA